MPHSLSIVVPIYNELENLPVLTSRIVASFDKLRLEDWEVILVDDGSTDGSEKWIRSFSQKHPRFHFIGFQSNCGQTAAIDAGFRAAKYPLIGTMDADLQNDPFDYEILLRKMKPDVGAVCGVRTIRHDTLSKRLASKFANWIRNRVTKDTITDTGCSLKVFQKEVLREIKLFDGMHRFLPTLIKMEGYKVIEVPVGHHPRFAGKSKYSNLARGWQALFDLMAVRWMQKRKLNYQPEQSPVSNPKTDDRRVQNRIH